MKFKFTNQSIALTIASIFLILSFFKGWPYGFFTLLRFIVFTISIYVARLLYLKNQEGWLWAYIFVAILFNPFIPIYLNRSSWITINLFVLLFFACSFFYLKTGEENLFKK